MKKFAEFSHEEKRRMVTDAIADLKKPTNPGKMETYPWLKEMYDDKCIVEDGGKLMEYPYVIAPDGSVTLGAATEVKTAYVPLAELKDIEIFEAGTYRGKTYTDDDLDQMAANFTALKDEIKPVMIIGHDEDQELLKASGLPAAGWLDSVKRVGKKLIASFKDVPKVVADLIGKGAYKRISSEIYTNYNGKGHALRRVALLGGEIPEVKTLQDVAALYDEAPAGDTTWVSLDEKTPESAAAAAAPATAPATRKENHMENMDVIELAEKVSDLTEKLTQLTEAVTTKDTRIAQLEGEKQAETQKFTEVERAKKTEDIHRFCSDRLKEGRISPAIWGLGLEQFMADLDDRTIVKFGEGKRTRELSPLGFMKTLIMQIPKNTLVKLGELAATGSDPKVNDTGLTAGERLADATKIIMKANPAMKFGEAFTQAQKDNPELAAEYAADSAAS